MGGILLIIVQQDQRSNPTEVSNSLLVWPPRAAHRRVGVVQRGLHDWEQEMQVRHPIVGCTINPILWLKGRKKE